MSTAKLKKEVIKNLQTKSLSLAEIAAAMELKEKKVFRLLRGLFEGGEIASFRGSDGIRKYRITTDEEKAATKKTNDEKAAVKADEGEEVDVDEEDEEDE